MIEVARKVIIIANHTKFGKPAMAYLAPIDIVDVIVSDEEAGSRVSGDASSERHTDCSRIISVRPPTQPTSQPFQAARGANPSHHLH